MLVCPMALVMGIGNNLRCGSYPLRGQWIHSRRRRVCIMSAGWHYRVFGTGRAGLGKANCVRSSYAIAVCRVAASVPSGVRRYIFKAEPSVGDVYACGTRQRQQGRARTDKEAHRFNPLDHQRWPLQNTGIKVEPPPIIGSTLSASRAARPGGKRHRPWSSPRRFLSRPQDEAKGARGIRGQRM